MQGHFSFQLLIMLGFPNGPPPPTTTTFLQAMLFSLTSALHSSQLSTAAPTGAASCPRPPASAPWYLLWSNQTFPQLPVHSTYLTQLRLLLTRFSANVYRHSPFPKAPSPSPKPPQRSPSPQTFPVVISWTYFLLPWPITCTSVMAPFL